VPNGKGARTLSHEGPKALAEKEAYFEGAGATIVALAASVQYSVSNTASGMC